GSTGDQRSGRGTGAGKIVPVVTVIPVAAVILTAVTVTRTVDDAERTLEGLVLRRRHDRVLTDVRGRCRSRLAPDPRGRSAVLIGRHRDRLRRLIIGIRSR